MQNLVPNQEGNYTFNKEELLQFINNAMQAKADSDKKSGHTKEAFTPAYQPLEFLKTIGVEFDN